MKYDIIEYIFLEKYFMSSIPPASPKQAHLPIEASEAEADEDYHCSICSEIFDRAVVTSCGHSFCEPCMKNWKATKKAEEYTCPSCREPLSKEKDPAPNVLLRKLIEKAKKIVQAPLLPLLKLNEMQKKADSKAEKEPEALLAKPAAVLPKQPPAAAAIPAPIKPVAEEVTSKSKTLQKLKSFVQNFEKTDYMTFKKELATCLDTQLAHQIMIAYSIGRGLIEHTLKQRERNHSAVVELLEGRGLISRYEKASWEKFIDTIEQIPEFDKSSQKRLEAFITCVQKYLKEFGKQDYNLFKLRLMALIDRPLAIQLATVFDIGPGTISTKTLPEIELGEKIVSCLEGKCNRDLKKPTGYIADDEIALTAFISKLEEMQQALDIPRDLENR